MKKQWLSLTIAGFALLATACGNTAAPDNRYGTTSYQSAPYTNYSTQTNYMTGGYSGTLTNGPALGGARYNTPIRGNQYGTLGSGSGPYGTIYNASGTNALRAGDRANYRMNDSMYKTGGVTTAGTTGTSGHTMPRIGYSKLDTNYQRTNSDHLNSYYVDRDVLAQVVGNVTVGVPGVKSSTVLVTDKEIFVGIKSDGPNAKTANPKVRTNAMSVSPRWFKVYVTDNQQMIDEMTRVYSRSSNVNVASPHEDRQIDNLIRSFGGSTDTEQMRGRANPSGTKTTGK
ncbi:YhcN/YlaJ family sporulation lipoprotein [Brevibacillus ginsengisoli]|uniref:YhcN/YlaJ family sporulation lipoprotein n=1 Tax=Brevibacillus ginsengisoli TaxID=363854 RepID=UPI003CEDE4EB